MRRRRGSSWVSGPLLAVLFCGCAASPAAVVHHTSRPHPPASASATPTAAVDTCLVGTWESQGGFSSPSGSGLAGLFMEVSSAGEMTINLDNTTPWSLSNGDQLMLGGTVTVRVGTSVSGSGQVALADLGEQDSQLTVTDTESLVTRVSGGLFADGLYRCGAAGLTITFNTVGSGLLAGSSGTLTQ